MDLLGFAELVENRGHVELALLVLGEGNLLENLGVLGHVFEEGVGGEFTYMVAGDGERGNALGKEDAFDNEGNVVVVKLVLDEDDFFEVVEEGEETDEGFGHTFVKLVVDELDSFCVFELSEKRNLCGIESLAEM